MMESEKRNALIQALARFPDQVIALALVYAQGMIHYGVDCTKAFDTATAQIAALDQAYSQGRYDEAKRRFQGTPPSLPENGPGLKKKEFLRDVLLRYFSIGNSYTYELTRVKNAFYIGTMDLSDFQEWTEENVDELVEYILRNEPFLPEEKSEGNNGK